MKKLITAIVGLALCAQAQIVFTQWEAEMAPTIAIGPGHMDVVWENGNITFTTIWDAQPGDPNYIYDGVDYTWYAQAITPTGHGDVWSWFLAGSPTESTIPEDYVGVNWPADLHRSTVEIRQNGTEDLLYSGMLYGVVPEPIAGTLVCAGMLLAVGLSRRRIMLLVCLALLMTSPVFAADDDPTPVVTRGLSENIEPYGFEIAMIMTPVTKVDGTNSASVVSIKITKLQYVRTLNAQGTQVGKVRVYSLGTRDATAWFFARTNVNGRVALNINDGRGSWVASAWNNSPEE